MAIEGVKLLGYGLRPNSSQDLEMKLSQASKYSEWTWRGHFNVNVSESGGYLGRWYVDDIWAFKEYVHIEEIPMKEVYIEGAARVIWKVQKEHRGFDTIVPWVAPPYGGTEEQTVNHSVNLPAVLEDAFVKSAELQGVSGSAMYYTMSHLELIRRGVFQYDRLDGIEFNSPGSAEGSRAQLKVRVNAELWKALGLVAIRERRDLRDLVDEAVQGICDWYEDDHESETHVPWVFPTDTDAKEAVYLHPGLVQPVEHIVDAEVITKATVLVTAIQLLYDKYSIGPRREYALLDTGIVAE